MKKTNVMFQSKPNYSSNAKALYEYMESRYQGKMNFYWVIDNTKDYERLKDKLNCVLNDSYEFSQIIDDIDIIFTTHGQLKEHKKNNQLYINLWHGLGMKKLGHFLSKDNFAPQDQEFYDILQSKTDYIIVPSRFWQMLFSVMFNFDYNRILPIGCPKLEPIVKADGRKNLENVLGIDINSYQKIIYYMPTFRNGCGRSDAKLNSDNVFNFQKYDEQKLITFLDKKNYLLCLKHHPEEENSFNYILSDNIKVIEETKLQEYDLSVNDILNAADLLITDYSSLGIEFSILDKPSIYLVNDIEEYCQKRGIIFDDIEFWTQGNLVNNIDDLLKIIDNLKLIKRDKKLKKIWFDDLKDGGCSIICDYFFEESGRLKKNLNYSDSIILKQEKQIGCLNDKICKITERKDYLERLNKQHEKELDLIYNSKSWKILEKLRRIKKSLFRH